MTRRLYDASTNYVPAVSAVTPPLVSVETLFSQLDNHLRAYESVQTVHAEIAGESLTFVDTKNVVLFNEYMRMLGKNFGVEAKLVNPAALEAQQIVTVNYELSLEGWMKDMWTKIKGFFTKIYESIKEFMKRHFTRLGRLKNKLKNIETAAKGATKELGQARLDDVPSGLASKFKGFNDISESVVVKTLQTATEAAQEVQTLSSITSKTAKDGILPSNIITEIKKLKEIALKAGQQIDANNSRKDGLGFIKDRKERSEINADNKTLAQTAKDAEKAADDKDTHVEFAGNDGDTGGDLETAGQEDFKKFLKQVVDSLEKFKGEPMIGGKTISKVSVSNDNELEVEFDEDGDPASGITLTNKEGIINLAGKALAMIEAGEKQVDIYTKTNDEIMKQLQAVDNLITDIDRNAPERYGKYRKVLDKSIRTRLNMMKVLFRSYNQVSRNFFEVTMNTGDAVVDYCVLSMKNFR